MEGMSGVPVTEGIHREEMLVRRVDIGIARTEIRHDDLERSLRLQDPVQLGHDGKHIVEVFEEIAARKDSLRGMRITWQPAAMRHFTAKFTPL